MIKLYQALLILLSLPLLLAEYFSGTVGREYGVGFWKKLWIALCMAVNRFRVPTASNFIEHLVMATEMLKVPKSLAGVVVECGCYKGGSTSNLSLVCAAADRRLVVFDSFCGLPEPRSGDADHIVLESHQIHRYAEGYWSGSLVDVRKNVARCGELSVCEFHPGYFEQTLPGFTVPVVFAFVDADLRESVKTCIHYLWPLFEDNCRMYTHEAQHQEVAQLFFDPVLWDAQKPPGLVGAGTGLGLIPNVGGFRSGIGYAVKNPSLASFRSSVEDGLR
ncbi:MAG TPA: TylF/MycF/NovP-related O-methyltransferase [Candidatus Acidoferrum sp.]|nr:TylF/MycF/NovP-related O-methyltransferase [Candidatus Acidoferrum sp.]